MKELLKRFVQEDSGQDLIEYALLAGFISLVAVAAITTVGTGINTVYGNLNTQVAAICQGRTKIRPRWRRKIRPSGCRVV